MGKKRKSLKITPEDEARFERNTRMIEARIAYRLERERRADDGRGHGRRQ
jgi:hypothetical protein